MPPPPTQDQFIKFQGWTAPDGQLYCAQLVRSADKWLCLLCRAGKENLRDARRAHTCKKILTRDNITAYGREIGLTNTTTVEEFFSLVSSVQAGPASPSSNLPASPFPSTPAASTRTSARITRSNAATPLRPAAQSNSRKPSPLRQSVRNAIPPTIVVNGEEDGASSSNHLEPATSPAQSPISTLRAVPTSAAPPTLPATATAAENPASDSPSRPSTALPPSNPPSIPVSNGPPDLNPPRRSQSFSGPDQSVLPILDRTDVVCPPFPGPSSVVISPPDLLNLRFELNTQHGGILICIDCRTFVSPEHAATHATDTTSEFHRYRVKPMKKPDVQRIIDPYLEQYSQCSQRIQTEPTGISAETLARLADTCSCTSPHISPHSLKHVIAAKSQLHRPIEGALVKFQGVQCNSCLFIHKDENTYKHSSTCKGCRALPDAFIRSVPVYQTFQRVHFQIDARILVTLTAKDASTGASFPLTNNGYAILSAEVQDTLAKMIASQSGPHLVHPLYVGLEWDRLLGDRKASIRNYASPCPIRLKDKNSLEYKLQTSVHDLFVKLQNLTAHAGVQDRKFLIGDEHTQEKLAHGKRTFVRLQDECSVVKYSIVISRLLYFVLELTRPDQTFEGLWDIIITPEIKRLGTALRKALESLSQSANSTTRAGHQNDNDNDDDEDDDGEEDRGPLGYKAYRLAWGNPSIQKAGFFAHEVFSDTELARIEATQGYEQDEVIEAMRRETQAAVQADDPDDLDGELDIDANNMDQSTFVTVTTAALLKSTRAFVNARRGEEPRDEPQGEPQTASPGGPLDEVHNLMIALLEEIFMRPNPELHTFGTSKCIVYSFLILVMVSPRPPYSKSTKMATNLDTFSASFVPPRHLPQLISPLKFFSRMLVYNHALCTARRENHKSTLDYMRGNTVQYLRPGQDTVFAVLNSLGSQAGMAVVSAVPLPNLKWLSGSSFQYTFNGRQYDWADVRSAIHDRAFPEMHKLVEEIFFGRKLAELIAMLPPLASVSDNTSDCTIGASFLSNTANAGLQQADKWLGNLVFGDPALRPLFIIRGDPQHSSSIVWNVPRIKAWLASIHRLQDIILWLQQLTCGPPKRATEVASETIINPNAASLRTLVVHDGLFGNATFYNKVTAQTGKSRCNVHFMDRKTSDILYVLLALARPFMVVLAPQVYNNTVALEWETFLWTSPEGRLSANGVRGAFVKASKRYLASPGYTIGATRHHLIALCRRVLDGPGYLVSVNAAFGLPTEAETRAEQVLRESFMDGDAALDLMAGHGSAIARLYGKDDHHVASGWSNTSSKNAMTTEKWNLQRSYCIGMHAFFHLCDDPPATSTSAKEITYDVLGKMEREKITDAELTRADVHFDKLSYDLRNALMNQIQTLIPAAIVASVGGAVCTLASQLHDNQIMAAEQSLTLPPSILKLPKAAPIMAGFDTEEAQRLLQKHLKDSHARFRTEAQGTAAALVIRRLKDIIVIEATGSGKTAIIAIAILALEGKNKVAIIVLPLLSLLDQFRKQFTAEFGENAVRQWNPCTTAVSDSTRVLLVSADQLQSSQFQATLVSLQRQDRIGFIAFDEVHIILADASYRPALEGIGIIAAQITRAPRFFFTATLPSISFEKCFSVLKLHPDETEIVRGPRTSIRKELSLCFPPARLFEASEENVALLIQEYVRPGTPDRAMVFVHSHDAAALYSARFNSPIYSAKLQDLQRPIVKEQWELGKGIQGIEAEVTRLAGKRAVSKNPTWRASDDIVARFKDQALLPDNLGLQVLIATQKSCSAGFHANHVRLIVTVKCCSESVIDFMQTAGRAARDGQPGVAVALDISSRVRPEEDLAFFVDDAHTIRQMAGLAKIGGNYINAAICRRVPALLYFDGNMEDVTSNMSARINGDLVQQAHLARTCIALGAQLCDVCHTAMTRVPLVGSPEDIVKALPCLPPRPSAQKTPLRSVAAPAQTPRKRPPSSHPESSGKRSRHEASESPLASRTMYVGMMQSVEQQAKKELEAVRALVSAFVTECGLSPDVRQRKCVFHIFADGMAKGSGCPSLQRADTARCLTACPYATGVLSWPKTDEEIYDLYQMDDRWATNKPIRRTRCHQCLLSVFMAHPHRDNARITSEGEGFVPYGRECSHTAVLKALLHIFAFSLQSHFKDLSKNKQMSTKPLPLALEFYYSHLIGTLILTLPYSRVPVWTSAREFVEWALEPDPRLDDFINLYHIVAWWYTKKRVDINTK